MRPLTEQEIRAAFVNCGKGEAKRVPMPRDLADTAWEDLDFLGWRDLGSPERSYLVAEHRDRVVAVALRSPQSRTRDFLHRSLCSMCLTTHPSGGVLLMAARKAGPAGRQGDSAGLHVCADMACSLYVRGRKAPAAGGRLPEDLSVEEMVARTRERLAGFLDRILG
ncbi:FBP domain-containing protein [Streptomonospora sp. S1-112]|uniref:FBP domain-containing protein n=1 Tax=Streptomonospora mangrovi TaxID=2883123 RepID=A0A9X3NRL1_9ACTN|nr:FBP domain-containing protein [Streptomonospora mangrovi]MDA0567880.1 FBP domain-containing protein [Streptomonospora mangrovi]